MPKKSNSVQSQKEPDLLSQSGKKLRNSQAGRGNEEFRNAYADRVGDEHDDRGARKLNPGENYSVGAVGAGSEEAE